MKYFQLMCYACNAENALKPCTMVNRDQFLKGGAAVSRVRREKGGGLEDRGDFCPKLIQPSLENIDRRKRNDGSRELIPMFHNPYRKGRSSDGSHFGVPSRGARHREGEKNMFGSTSNRPVKILNVIIRSARSCHRCKE